ncbi:MAG: FlgD immunoglobulin-like domain containing protein, partial [Candidatus Krumholzibacteriia bacterium]
AQPTFDAFVIEPWDDSYDLATSFIPDINELNNGVGIANLSGGTTAKFTWSEAGGMQEADIGPYEINNLGVTASNSAVFWGPGDYELIPTPDSGGSPALVDLNNLNVVVGSATALGKSRALVWDPEHGSRWLDDYGLPDSTSTPYAINDSGRIAATHHEPMQFTSERAFVFDLSTQEYFGIHDMLNPSGDGITRVVDVAENGIVVGEGTKEAYGGGIAGFIWTETGGFTFMPGLNGGQTRRVHPRSVNSTATAVGRALDGQNEWRAFIWNPDYGMQDLESLAVLPDGFNLEEALVINENGWIVALGFWGDTFGPQRAVVFVPRDGIAPVRERTPTATRVSLRSRGPGERGGSRLSFTLPEAAYVRLSLHDLRGRRIATLESGMRAAGTHEVTWNSRLADGRPAATGVYLALLEAGPDRATAKVLVLR